MVVLDVNGKRVVPRNETCVICSKNFRNQEKPAIVVKLNKYVICSSCFEEIEDYTYNNMT